MRENVDKSENNAEQAGIRKATHSPQQLGLIKKRIIQLNAKMILLKEVVLTQIALRINDPFSKSVGVFS